MSHAVAETRRVMEAADRLAKMRPESNYSRQAVIGVLDRLRVWAPQPLLEKDGRGVYNLTNAGEQFLRAARNVVNEDKLMRQEIIDRGLPTMACLPHHLHFVAQAENILASRPDAPSASMIVKVLEQRHRGEALDLTDVVGALVEAVEAIEAETSGNRRKLSGEPFRVRRPAPSRRPAARR